MSRSSQHVRYRREFLRFLAASPLMAYGLREAWAQEPGAAALAKDVLSVMDFEALARPRLPPAHWGYMASGTDDNLTLQANIAAYKNVQLRPRRLVDVSKLDTSVELFGQRVASPIFLCPVGGHRMFHADGEVATARAARAKNALQVLSTQTSIAVEEVAAARGGGLWYQLYMPATWDDTEKMVRRVEAAGLSGARLDHRPPGRAQSRIGHARTAHRHASMRGVPRHGHRWAPQQRDVHRSQQHTVQPVQCHMGLGGSAEEDDVDEGRPQGCRDGRGRQAGAGARRRRHPGVQPRRPRRRNPAGHHRHRAGSGGRREQPDSGAGGRRRAARRGRVQGDRATGPARLVSAVPTRGGSHRSVRTVWSACSTSSTPS